MPLVKLYKYGRLQHGGRVNTGRIGGIELSNRGTGYVAPPTVHFLWSGFGAKLRPRLLMIQQIHAMVK